MASSASVLRELSGRLRAFGTHLRAWLAEGGAAPEHLEQRAELERASQELLTRAHALEAERPLLVVMLMGGTGVGKSTLLNALAGANIAPASFQRPTTRDPVVYCHRSVDPDKLDPLLRRCRLVQHDRPELAQKVVVDTPDLDSNDLANRETLERVLPVADIVLYVGSQEKYHDQIGWEAFKRQKKRRAFAFVLNKWDRCLQPGAQGLRPDEDLLRDLKSEGFPKPVLFRTVAQAWLDARAAGQSAPPPDELPEGEQFAELLNWLERGLSGLEIEVVKSRGVGQLLAQVRGLVIALTPPDLAHAAEAATEAWGETLREEAAATTEVLMGTLEPFQTEIEHHFRVEGQGKFTGMYAAYLSLITKVRFAGSKLRERLPVPALPKGVKVGEPAAWSLAAFTLEASRKAGERVLDQRVLALGNRLLVQADRAGFPLSRLTAPTREAGRLDWRERYDRALREGLAVVEERVVRPSGVRRLLQQGLIWSANSVPAVMFIGSILVVLWKVFMVEGYRPQWLDFLLPVLVTLSVLVLLQALIAVLLPLRWAAIRAAFEAELGERMGRELLGVYGPIPGDAAARSATEREKASALADDAGETLVWLESRLTTRDESGLFGEGAT